MLPSHKALVLLFVHVAISGAAAQYEFGQATWYDSILNGFCGFGSNIPSNGFVGAWPFIETGPGAAGYWQDNVPNACADVCFEVSCVPQFVESADGSIYLDRRDACADPNRAIVIKIVDECRCSQPPFPGAPRGNFQWCCNTPTPRLGINRHIDLSKQAFSALVKDGNFNVGIIGIRWRRTSCNIGVITLPTSPPNPPGGITGGVPNSPQTPPQTPPGMTWHDMAHTGNAPFPEFMQCGGKGSVCQMFGPCADEPFPAFKCAAGLSCQRQNEWYYQCLKSSGGGSSSSSSGGTSSGGSGGSNVLGNSAQCGGLGGNCKDVHVCVDGPFPGTSCGPNLRCVRQNQYYYQCLDANAIAHLGSDWQTTKP